ncbi:MAG: phenylalanine--tRNA ligase subunit beta [Candidatus Margulisiibacteriota bacterium]
MKIPFEWLKDFVSIKIKPEELADRLIMTGLEVGAIEYHGRGISGIVVGKIKSAERLPSDHHLVCRIDIGKKMLDVITEDETLNIGEKVPVALEGSTIAGGIAIKKQELHGVEVFGYLLKPHELGLYEETRVLRLPKDAMLGEDVMKYIGTGSCVLDIDILPNRGDCASVLGAAREVSALLKTKLKVKPVKVRESKEKIRSRVRIEVKDKELCPRYMARMVENVTVKESPEWLKNRLLLAGMRPINNIVDVTNYLLAELGQPMHAFDAALIKENKIVVRKASAGEKMTTLDGIERKLEPKMLVIADEKYPIALAGIMGGANSEVSNSTTSVLLESAYFNPISINRTSKAMKLRTEASVRFEKGVDWNMVEEALDRAAMMIAELSGGAVVGGKIDVKGKEKKNKILELRQEKLFKTLGIKIPIKEAGKILKSLGFDDIKVTGNKLRASVPSWRASDIEREIDMIEEVARIYGYNEIKTTIPAVREDNIESELGTQRKIRDILVGCGLYETQTFSLVDPKMADSNAVVISNPMTPEESVLRTGMINSLLKVISHNLRHQIDEVNIFELGKIFLPGEKLVVAGAMTGGGADFFRMKGVVEKLLSSFSDLWKYESFMDDRFHPGKSALVLIGPKEKVLGKFGALHPEIQKAWGLTHEVYVFEFDLDLLFELPMPKKQYRPLPKFPKVERDLAMFVPEDVSSKAIIELISKSGGELVEEVKLFDRYKNSQAYRISFRDHAKTLTDETVNPMFKNIQNELELKLKVQIRK